MGRILLWGRGCRGTCSLVPYGLPLHQVKACEALEALDELLESDLPIITPHLSEVLMFCLEVSLGWGLPLVLFCWKFSCSFLIFLSVCIGGKKRGP